MSAGSEDRADLNSDRITVGQLRNKLRFYPMHAPAIFGGPELAFGRLKNRGGDKEPIVHIEFNEIYTIDDSAED